MQFPYHRNEVTPNPAFPDGVLYRPVVRIRVTGPTSDAFLWGLVDTGADSTILSYSVARDIGVFLDQQDVSPASGFTGDAMQVAYAEVEFEMMQREERHRWRSVVGFVDFPPTAQEQTLLGQTGFLDQFHTSFNPRQRHLTLSVAE